MLLAGEDSDLTSLLASKAAKRNDQSKSAHFCTSSASFRSAVGRAESDDEDVCNLASSPESDQGRAHADNTPISGGSRGHPHRQSLSMQKGPRRRWSPESSSASLNRCLHSCSACNPFCHAHLWSCRVALFICWGNQASRHVLSTTPVPCLPFSSVVSCSTGNAA